MNIIKKLIVLSVTAAVILSCLTGCSEKSELDPDNPVTLTMWHVYGEQADSPMNRLIDEFNKTTGKEKGIIINVTMLSNATQIGDKLLSAQAEEPGSQEMPDLFFCHKKNAENLGIENLLDWKNYFTETDLDKYVPEFIEDGMIGDTLAVFPVSKSTHLLFLAGSEFDRFSADTGVTYDSLATWSGFFNAAEKYYDWSGGKPFCALDYILRCVELNTLASGGPDFYTDNGWYNPENPQFKASWMKFAAALIKGHIVISDMYSNTQVMTGDVAGGIGSSASILYYNDTITYSDNTKEPTNLKVLPLPQNKSDSGYITQAGVGLCSYMTTSQKAEAAVVFAKWLTESERNLQFVTDTGYMPVNNESFSKIKDFEFENESYKQLYNALAVSRDNCISVQEPSFTGYYQRVNKLYGQLRSSQSSLHQRYTAGEDISQLTEETWQMLLSVK